MKSGKTGVKQQIQKTINSLSTHPEFHAELFLSPAAPPENPQSNTHQIKTRTPHGKAQRQTPRTHFQKTRPIESKVIWGRAPL
jgi:hypothetical protein